MDKTIPELILHRYMLEHKPILDISMIDPTHIEVIDKDRIVYKDTGLIRPLEVFPDEDMQVDKYQEKGYPKILPMKAKDYVPRRHSSWFTNEKVCSQFKHDGVRTTMHIRNNINRLFTGGIVKNGWVGEKSDQVPHLRDYSMYEYRGTILDGELVSPTGHTIEDFKLVTGALNSKPKKAIEKQMENGFLYFIAFDIIEYKGFNVRNLPYDLRYRLMMDVVMGDSVPKNPYIIPANTVWKTKEKKAMLEYSSEIGNEGIMLRHNKLPYTEDYKSGQMLKLKDRITLDMVCIGFYEANEGKTGQFKGLIGGMMLGVYMDEDEASIRNLKPHNEYVHFKDGKKYKHKKVKGRVLVHLGNLSGMTVPERKDMTMNPDKYVGEVVELYCNRTYPDTRVPRNPRFIRLHGQKTAIQVTFEDHCEQADVIQILEV